MKTDTMTLKTTKSVQELSVIIREAAAKLRASVDSPELSPFGNVGIRQADISVALSGPNFILGGPRRWGMQILVIDTGRTREVELIAVGDDFFGKLSRGSYGRAFYELGDSVRRRNMIIDKFR